MTASELPNLSQRDENPQSAFETTGVEFRPDQYFPKVTGEVVSKYKQSVTEVHVTAVCFDASDGIIGGGETYVTAVGAGQSVGFEVGTLILGESPAKCTAYADLSAISQAS